MGTAIPVAMILVPLLAWISYSDLTRQGSSRNAYSNAIETQNAARRSVAFARLMHDAGEVCTRTSRSLFRGDIGPNAAWTLRCEDSGDWMILIASNGAARVASCGPLERAGTPCWTRL